VSDETDAKVLNDVQERFEVNITELPEEIDLSSYSECLLVSVQSKKCNLAPLVYFIGCYASSGKHG
jgi:hypothetical protein